MAKIRGKKFTIAQIKEIKYNTRNDPIDINDWLYYGEEIVDDAGNKCASKNSSKTKYIKIIHRVTGEIKSILIS
jgi:hypothetical protein